MFLLCAGVVPEQTNEVEEETRGGNGNGEAETRRGGRERRRGSEEQRGEAAETGTGGTLRTGHLAEPLQPRLQSALRRL